MGTHDLRGVSQLVEVFALDAEDDTAAGGGGI
jgi:hypothetical protein